MTHEHVSLDGRPKRKRDAMASCNEGIQAEFSGKGIKQLPNGDWWVPVAWHQWKVTSARPITNLEDATNLHIALVDIRRAFKDRHKLWLSQLADVGCDVQAAADFDDCPVMTRVELLTLLRSYSSQRALTV